MSKMVLKSQASYFRIKLKISWKGWKIDNEKKVKNEIPETQILKIWRNKKLFTKF